MASHRILCSETCPTMPSSSAMWWVYILRCSDRHLYVGHTGELTTRIACHNAGLASRFTARRRPVILAYSESHQHRAAAVAREQQLKRWSAAKKEALIVGDATRLKELSRRSHSR